MYIINMIWKTISKAPQYEVSSRGHIRRIGKTKNIKEDIWNGYSRVELRVNGRRKKFRVNRLVAEAFVLGFCNNCVVDHINRDRSNNHVKNLRISTPIKNNKNKISKIGVINHIIELYESGYSPEEIYKTVFY